MDHPRYSIYTRCRSPALQQPDSPFATSSTFTMSHNDFIQDFLARKSAPQWQQRIQQPPLQPVSQRMGGDMATRQVKPDLCGASNGFAARPTRTRMRGDMLPGWCSGGAPGRCGLLQVGPRLCVRYQMSAVSPAGRWAALWSAAPAGWPCRGGRAVS